MSADDPFQMTRSDRPLGGVSGEERYPKSYSDVQENYVDWRSDIGDGCDDDLIPRGTTAAAR